jgi:hypothetical protein
MKSLLIGHPKVLCMWDAAQCKWLSISGLAFNSLISPQSHQQNVGCVVDNQPCSMPDTEMGDQEVESGLGAPFHSHLC